MTVITLLLGYGREAAVGPELRLKGRRGRVFAASKLPATKSRTVLGGFLFGDFMDYGDQLFLPLHAFATVSVISALIFGFMAVYRIEAFDRLVDTAFRSEQRSLWDDFPPPPYHPRRVWRILFIAFSVVGFGVVFYGIFVRLFGWMPYDWHGTEDDIWIAEYLAGLATGLLLLGLFPWGAKLQERIARYRALEAYKLAMERYEAIFSRLLTCPLSAVDFWAGYGERFLSFQSKTGALAATEADRLIGLVRAVKMHRKHGEAAALDEQIRQNLSSSPVAGEGYEDVEEPSQKALALIEFVCRERNRLELFDEGNRLREIVPKSPDGISPPGFRISQSAHNDDGPVLRTGGTAIKPAYEHRRDRLIQNILWADQQGAVEEVDKYLRSEARWQITRLR